MIRRLNTAQREALKAVLAYNWATERTDYVKQRELGNIAPNDPAHIFTSLVALATVLTGVRSTAEIAAYTPVTLT